MNWLVIVNYSDGCGSSNPREAWFKTYEGAHHFWGHIKEKEQEPFHPWASPPEKAVYYTPRIYNEGEIPTHTELKDAPMVKRK